MAQKQVHIQVVPITTSDLQSRIWLNRLAIRFKKAGVSMLYLPSDSLVISNAKMLVTAIQQTGIPVFSATETPIRKGGALIGVVSNYWVVGQFAGFKALEILRDHRAPASVHDAIR